MFQNLLALKPKENEKALRTGPGKDQSWGSIGKQRTQQSRLFWCLSNTHNGSYSCGSGSWTQLGSKLIVLLGCIAMFLCWLKYILLLPCSLGLQELDPRRYFISASYWDGCLLHSAPSCFKWVTPHHVLLHLIGGECSEIIFVYSWPFLLHVPHGN